MAEQLTVFIVDDDQAFRGSMVWLLEGAGYACCDFESAEAFLESYDNQLGCLLLDIRMPGLSGLELQKRLNQDNAALPVILVTGHGNVACAVEGMKNRAVDFIEKPFDDEVFLLLVAETLQLVGQRFSQAEEEQAVQRNWSSLSRREKQVANLVAQGLTNREIAEALAIHTKTVEVHRSRVMRKMDCVSLAKFIDAFRLLTKKN